MRKLNSDHASRREKDLQSGNEIVNIWNLGEDVVAKQQISALTLGHELARRIHAKEFHERRDSLVDRHCCYVCCRLDPKNRDFRGNKVLQKIAVIAGDFYRQTALIEAKPCDHLFAITLRMGNPAVRVRRKICVVAEDILGAHVLFDLGEEALSAHANVQRIKGLHLIELLPGQIALAQRRHAEIYESLSQWLSAKKAARRARRLINRNFIVRNFGNFSNSHFAFAPCCLRLFSDSPTSCASVEYLCQ